MRWVGASPLSWAIICASDVLLRCYAALCAHALLCYAESNDHWSLRVCPIPNLNLIPVVRSLPARRW